MHVSKPFFCWFFHLPCSQFLLARMQTVLTRVNTLTGVAYKDDPTILGWELMNEPRCDAEPTGAMVQVSSRSPPSFLHDPSTANQLARAPRGIIQRASRALATLTCNAP